MSWNEVVYPRSQLPVQLKQILKKAFIQWRYAWKAGSLSLTVEPKPKAVSAFSARPCCFASAGLPRLLLVYSPACVVHGIDLEEKRESNLKT